VTGIEEIRQRHADLVTRLRAISEANGHDPMALQIVGVTKTHSVDVARAALAAGIERLGESRVQEAEPKIRELPTAEWHLVGRLQSNKARRAVRSFDVIHSVHSADLLAQLERVAAEEDREPRFLLQVNLTGEVAKGGMTPDELLAMAGDLGGGRVIGLMTIARMGATGDQARATFGQLRALRDRLREASGEPLEELSMGMSDDAEAAAAEGATLVRIGTALFGPRA
jgi:pyridoxal phosphate enzyme (YggS family)